MEEKEFWAYIDKGKTFKNKTFNFDIKFTSKDSKFSNPIIYRHKIEFINCEFLEAVLFTNAQFIGDVSFTSCVFKGSLTFQGAKFKSSLLLKNVTSEIIYFLSGEFYFTIIKPKEVGVLQIEGGEFQNSLWITDETMENNRILKNLIFNFIWISGNIKIDLINIEKILLSGINKTNISFNKITAKELVFYRFFNSGYLTVDWWKRNLNNSCLRIENSNLKNVEITNSDLHQLDKFIVSASNLSELVLNNCTLKYDLDYKEAAHISELDKFRIAKDAYRQLKIAMSRQSDKVNELKFHSLEMHTYSKMLNWNEHFWTKLILVYDKITSDFGQDLKRALAWLFGLHLFLYLILIGFFDLNGITPSIANAEWKYFWKAFGDYLNLILPTHKFLDNADGRVHIIDFLMRFFSSLLIYNIIRVARRFAAK
jgi:uncharacterized protein YjbI with pentapeptide repeats